MFGETRLDKDPTILADIRKLRTKINAKVEKAKSDYAKEYILGATWKDPTKFWRNIKSILDKGDDNLENMIFKDPMTGNIIDDESVPFFWNDFFANISDRVWDPSMSRPFVPNDIGESKFFFIPPKQ